MKKLIIILLLFPSVCLAAVNYADSFSGDTLDPKWTGRVLMGSGSYTVSGGCLNIQAVSGGGASAYEVYMAGIALPCNIFIKFTESGTIHPANQTVLNCYKTAPQVDDMGIMSVNNTTAYSVKNLGATGGSQTMGASPFYFNVIIDGSGVMTVKTKNGAGTWVTCTPPNGPINFGSGTFTIGLTCIAGTGTMNSHIEWINDSDSDPDTPTPTPTPTPETPQRGFWSWKDNGFYTWP